MYLQQTIDRIFAHLKELKRPIFSRRRPGIDTATMSSELESMGLSAPAELLELYRECDGTQTNPGEILDDIHFFPGYYWLSFDEALTTYRSFLLGSDWNAAWFPIFANGGGDFYAVICDKSSPDFGGVVGFLLGAPDVLVEFVDICALMKTIDQSYEKGAFFEENGYLEVNFKEMRMVARSVQPNFVEHEFRGH